jgi:hypothetical protein
VNPEILLECARMQSAEREQFARNLEKSHCMLFETNFDN